MNQFWGLDAGDWALALVLTKCLGAIFALIAGGMWWRACCFKVRISDEDKRLIPEGMPYATFYDGRTIAYDNKNRRFDPVATLIGQEKWNSYAAAATAVAAFVQAAVLIIESLRSTGVIPGIA